MIQPTSLEAYNILKPQLGERQKQVYNVIKLYPGVCNLDIRRITSIPINSVTPRVKELREKGLVIQNGYKIDRPDKRLTNLFEYNRNSFLLLVPNILTAYLFQRKNK